MTRRALLAGIARDEGPGYDEVRLGIVLMLAHPEQPLPDVVVSEPVRRWSELVFVYDRFRGGFDSLTRPLFESLEPWVVPRLGGHHDYAFLALAMAQWSIRRDVDDHRLLDAIDLLAARGGIPPDAAAGFSILDLQRRVRQGDPAVPLLAQRLLDGFVGRLTGTEMFQLVGLLAHDTAAAVEHVDTVIGAVDALMRDWRTTTPHALFMADRRGAHFPLLGDVISAFLQERRADLLGPTLGAWVEVPANERRNDLLYWVVSGEPGIGWGFDGTVELRHDSASVLDYVRVLSSFLNVGISVIADGPDAGEWPLDGEPRQPNNTGAAALQDAAREVLAVEQLRHVLDAAAPKTPGAMVILQEIGSPAQPLLLREFGRHSPGVFPCASHSQTAQSSAPQSCSPAPT